MWEAAGDPRNETTQRGAQLCPCRDEPPFAGKLQPCPGHRVIWGTYRKIHSEAASTPSLAPIACLGVQAAQPQAALGWPGEELV